MSDRVSKELSPSAKSLKDSRECFIEVHIDNCILFVIIWYNLGSQIFWYETKVWISKM